MESEPLALMYFRLFFGKFAVFILLSLSVVFLYHQFIVGKTLVKIALSALALAATNCIYNLPYYYLLETALGYDWIESTLSSLLINLLIFAIDLTKLLLLTLLAARLSMLFSKKKTRKEHSKAILSGDGSHLLMLEAPEQRALFSSSAAIFLYSVILEIVDVVDHLVQYGSFRNSELIFVVLEFVFIIALMVLSYILQILVYNHYRKAYKNDEEI